jgi:hypothetical protein
MSLVEDIEQADLFDDEDLANEYSTLNLLTPNLLGVNGFLTVLTVLINDKKTHHY